MSKQYIFKIKDHHDNVYDEQVRRDIIQGRPLPSLENASSSGCRKSRYVTIVTITINIQILILLFIHPPPTETEELPLVLMEIVNVLPALHPWWVAFFKSCLS